MSDKPIKTKIRKRVLFPAREAFTAKKAAQCLGISPHLLRAFLRDGSILGFKCGLRWLVPKYVVPHDSDDRG